MRKSLVYFFLQFFLLFPLFYSCSQEKKQETLAPSPTTVAGVTTSSILEIAPLFATRDTTFYISSKGLDLSKARIQWFVNERPVEGAITPEFKPAEIRRGDSVRAKAIIENQEMISKQITISNIPPTIVRARIVPAIPKAEDTLKVDATGSDRDGDKVSFIYEWSTNGESAVSGETLEGPFKRGDKISVKITPYDGYDYGQAIILSTNIHNSPPRPKGDGERFENDLYSYQIKATDPDGDVITYALRQGPKGMVIDVTTGLITWKVEENDAGRHPVTVQITDGNGGEVLYNFDVTVGLERR